VLYALSGGLLPFVSRLTSIAQLQSNKFEQRGLEIILTDPDSFKTTTSSLPSVLLKTNLTWSLQTYGIPIHRTYFTKRGSHNSMNSIELLHCALKNLLRLKTMVLVHLPWFEHFIHHSPWVSSFSSWNLLVHYRVLLLHVKILKWIQHD
jgi:hypothetical protein